MRVLKVPLPVLVLTCTLVAARAWGADERPAAVVAASAWGVGERPATFVRTPGPEEQAAVRKEFGPGFRVLATNHYRVISNASVRYHSVVAGVLEQFHRQVRPRFFATDIQPATFYLINEARDYERFMRSKGMQELAASFGVYDARTHALYARRYFQDGSESGFGTLFHEAMHAMMAAEFRGHARPPAWINEGFASLFEWGRVVRGRWVYGNPNPWRETPFRRHFEAGETPSLTELLAMPDSKVRGPKEQADLAYNSGRSLFLYVLLDRGELALRTFISELQRGRPAGPALQRATGLSLAEIEAGWRRSIQEVNFGGDYVNRAVGPDAFQILKTGAARHPSYGYLRLRLAQAYLERGELEPAIRHARAALEDPRLIYPNFAHAVIARAILPTDAAEAARNLYSALAQQPWAEHVMDGDFELLARMHEHVGDPGRAKTLRGELTRLRELDRAPRRAGHKQNRLRSGRTDKKYSVQ